MGLTEAGEAGAPRSPGRPRVAELGQGAVFGPGRGAEFKRCFFWGEGAYYVMFIVVLIVLGLWRSCFLFFSSVFFLVGPFRCLSLSSLHFLSISFLDRNLSHLSCFTSKPVEPQQLFARSPCGTSSCHGVRGVWEPQATVVHFWG